ncbi:unnamed protein product, partial [Oppiella nova]
MKTFSPSVVIICLLYITSTICDISIQDRRIREAKQLDDHRKVNAVDRRIAQPIADYRSAKQELKIVSKELTLDSSAGKTRIDETLDSSAENPIPSEERHALNDEKIQTDETPVLSAGRILTDGTLDSNAEKIPI